MWGKKKKKFLIGVLVKKWRQRQKKGLLVKLGQNFNILSANYCYSYLFFQVMKKKKKKKKLSRPILGVFQLRPRILDNWGVKPSGADQLFFKDINLKF